jgi:hypothetical protein
LAKLLAVEVFNRADFSDKFIEYDTKFDGGHYPLPPAKYMVLVFLGNDLIPFTTVRRFTEEKFRYYHSSIGCHFDIVIVAAAERGAEPVQPTHQVCKRGKQKAQPAYLVGRCLQCRLNFLIGV